MISIFLFIFRLLAAVSLLIGKICKVRYVGLVKISDFCSSVRFIRYLPGEASRKFMTFHATRVLQIVAAVKQPLLKRDMFIQSLLVNDFKFTTAGRALYGVRVCCICFLRKLTSRRANEKKFGSTFLHVRTIV